MYLGEGRGQKEDGWHTMAHATSRAGDGGHIPKTTDGWHERCEIHTARDVHTLTGAQRFRDNLITLVITDAMNPKP